MKRNITLMKFMRILIVLLLCTFTVAPAQASIFWWKNKKKKEIAAKELVEKRKADSLKNVTSYDKLFAGKKNLISKKSFVTLNKLDDKLYLEVPLELFGRELLLSSHITKTSDVGIIFAGANAMTPQRLVIERTDSVVTLRRPSYNVSVTDTNIAGAMKASRIGAIVKTFPIVARTNDSTAIVFEVTSLFSSDNKDLVNLKGRKLPDEMFISSHDPIAGASLLRAVEAYTKSITVSMEMGYTLGLSVPVFNFELSRKPELAIELNIALTLLPEEKMPIREADPRVGTQFVKYTAFDAGSGTRNGYYASRWKLELDSLTAQPRKPIVIYVDTLFPTAWGEAIRKGIEAWNPLLEAAGFKDAIVVKPYSRDSTFFAGDPLNSCVGFGLSSHSNITMRTLTDPRTGEILSLNLSVPRDYAASVRKTGVYLMAHTDPRFREYFLDETVITEAITADIIRGIGLGLGLSPNMAGSAAYTPQQLRSPEFTRENGITASVTDEIRYNYVALPGDREKGVALVVSQPGVYDRHAIKWLYTPIAGNEKDTLNHWLNRVSADARYYYGKVQNSDVLLDPRSLPGDLSSDVLTATDNILQHLKYIARESPNWMKNDSIPDGYKVFFPEFLYLRLEAYVKSLAYTIGGVYLYEYRDGTEVPSYLPVPREQQRKALQKMLAVCDDFYWLDVNREYVTMGGPNNNNAKMAYFNMPVRTILSRLNYLSLSEDKSQYPYSCEELLNDLSEYLFRDVVAGRQIADHKIIFIGQYIFSLISRSEVLQANVIAMKNKPVNVTDSDLIGGLAASSSFYPKAMPQNEFIDCNDPDTRAALFDEAMEQLTGIGFYVPKNIEALYYMKLQEARQKLRAGKAFCKDQYMRDIYDYYINRINLALDTK
jgi:hypothetical protein